MGRLSLAIKRQLLHRKLLSAGGIHTRKAHDQGMHTPMCLSVHTNTSTSTFVHVGYLSICVHPLTLPTPSLLSRAPHSSAMTGHFITRQHRSSPPTRGRAALCQSFDTLLAEEVSPHPASRESTTADLTTCLHSLSV